MTKKDYIIVAKCMNEIYAPAWEYLQTHLPEGKKESPETPEAIKALHCVFTVGEIMGKMFNAFEKDNPKFDWSKFKAAVYKK